MIRKCKIKGLAKSENCQCSTTKMAFKKNWPLILKMSINEKLLKCNLKTTHSQHDIFLIPPFISMYEMGILSRVR